VLSIAGEVLYQLILFILVLILWYSFKIILIKIRNTARVYVAKEIEIKVQAIV